MDRDRRRGPDGVGEFDVVGGGVGPDRRAGWCGVREDREDEGRMGAANINDRRDRERERRAPSRSQERGENR